MTALTRDNIPREPMSVDEFLAWSATVPGRYELENGHVVVLQSERAAHVRVKFAAQSALKAGLSAAGKSSNCEMLADGVVVRIDSKTSYEPDALVYCGPKLDPDVIEVPSPALVVEVTSPSTGFRDETEKLLGYAKVPSIMHYLIVNPRNRVVIHFARQSDQTFLTGIVGKGVLRLDPPGISIDIDQLFE